MASQHKVGSSECQESIENFREMCCGENEPNEVSQVPTKPPTYNGPTGNYQKCDICRDGDYPGNTAMVINMLYIGYGSCAQFYDYGQAGLIQDHLCQALQFFAYEPCGCGEYNTRENKPVPSTVNTNPNPAPAPVPVSSGGNDNARPTPQSPELPAPTSPRPTLRPTNQPTSRPTSKPTNRPTLVPTSKPTSPPVNRPFQLLGGSMSAKSGKMGGMKKDKRRLA